MVLFVFFLFSGQQHNTDLHGVRVPQRQVCDGRVRYLLNFDLHGVRVPQRQVCDGRVRYLLNFEYRDTVLRTGSAEDPLPGTV